MVYGEENPDLRNVYVAKQINYIDLSKKPIKDWLVKIFKYIHMYAHITCT